MSVKWLCLDLKQSSSTKTEFDIHILISAFSSEGFQSKKLRLLHYQGNVFRETFFGQLYLTEL